MSSSFASLLLPLFGTLVGASVPVLLGYLLFARQKNIEVKMQLHSEKRQIYRDFISSLVELNSSLSVEVIGDTDLYNFDERLVDNANNNLALVRIYSNQKVFGLGKELLQRVHNMQTNTSSDEELSDDSKTIFNLSEAMKEDLDRGLR